MSESHVDTLRDIVHDTGMAILTLSQAAEQLGHAPATLRRQVNNGVLRATLIGKTYVVTEKEVERYRANHLGKRRSASK